MGSKQSQDGGRHVAGNAASQRPPEWADGLKQLYDQVVEEALPDAFKDLLDRLDSADPAARPRRAAPSAEHPDKRR